MTAVEIAALVVVIVCMAATALLALAAVSLLRTLKTLRALTADLHEKALPLIVDLQDIVRHAADEQQRLSDVIKRVERISHTVDSASKLLYKAFAPPLIKSVSLMSGAGKAAKRLRSRHHDSNGDTS